ncbi:MULTISPECIES: glycine betaine/L-proline ABC transporter substrate-binding protein ProX [Vibrio]|jgi:glycine betaine/proline transport system substrate-binding protein|uniref:Proline/glycine betaine ABC transporter substrate-binding protein ProX n=3 Tax=Vibrio TaxID=662 RepID=A0ABR9Z745_VIBAN|nr:MULTISPECIES: glycine betaine/L-proline ABC transporter substrate-binding protein ProX [Vibrio]AQM20914.1 glycine betaine ABC transporter substrate-binding protein [Vibrio anguillarum]AQP38091.1 glycine betaine ABC transporter substrate-binding protein [Vibrio anguillarum]AUB85929.1 proline/glycine betaine ABC transporter substrate-binding protein ProX [Vibrio anguillarum]AUB89367.1 proline/glycine betaine ABC transporter substrate-binding protein ProX [Vibrio anguillarum]AUB92808.1 proline
MNYAWKTLISTSLIASAALPISAWADKLPGKGISVQPVQSTVAEETFQTLIVNKAMEALGYDVKPTKEVDYNVAYTSIAEGDATYLAVGWFPLHADKYSMAGGDAKFYRKGQYISGAAQGYLIDKKTADKYGITNIAQLKDPKIAKLFDANGDGKADLTGCTPGWGCEMVIEEHLTAYGLRPTVTHNQGNYAAIIADTISRYKKGDPILYYTWTPYWVSGVLVPGKDVTWLEVPFSALPGERKNIDTTLPNGKNFGFEMNSMLIVANKKFALENPAAAKLFEIMKLNINDISAQNMIMSKGKNSAKDIEAHANGWIKAHQSEFDSWIKTAKEAAK